MSSEFDVEAELVRAWKPPSSHDLEFRRRVFDIQMWLEKQHRFVHEEEIVRFAMQRFNVGREQARKYLKEVVDQCRHAGVPVLNY